MLMYHNIFFFNSIITFKNRQSSNDIYITVVSCNSQQKIMEKFFDPYYFFIVLTFFITSLLYR